MLNKCPYCKCELEENSKYLFCPYCGEELPKNSNNGDVNYDLFKPDNTTKEIKTNRKRKSFIQIYTDYAVSRAYLNIYVSCVFGVLVFLGSIIGAFYNIFFIWYIIICIIIFN